MCPPTRVCHGVAGMRSCPAVQPRMSVRAGLTPTRVNSRSTTSGDGQVGPGLDVLGDAEVVQRQGEYGGVGGAQLGGQLPGQGESRALGVGALLVGWKTSCVRQADVSRLGAVTRTPAQLACRAAIVYLSAMPMRSGGGSAASSAASPSAPSTAASVVLVAGSRDQLSEPAAARDLYISPLFARRRTRAEASGVPWFVVSGRWGLLAPGDIVAPYSFSLAQQPVSYQRAWARFVAEQLHLVSPVGRGDIVEIYTGAAYAAALTAPIEYLGARVRRATAGASDSRDEPR